MQFLQIDSKLLDLPENHYDFMMIDGDHGYDHALSDVKTGLKSMKHNGIMCVDDFYIKDVWRVIEEQLVGQNDWVPFLMGPQCMFFHHISHRADNFLDHWLPQTGRDLVKLYNISIIIGETRQFLSNCWIRYESIEDLIDRMRQYNL